MLVGSPASRTTSVVAVAQRCVGITGSFQDFGVCGQILTPRVPSSEQSVVKVPCRTEIGARPDGYRILADDELERGLEWRLRSNSIEARMHAVA